MYKVYEEIADHFSGTRHSPWPKVKEFLCNLPAGSLVADVGCGNGKYFGVNPKLITLGSDRSLNLAKICVERNFEVTVADCLHTPYRYTVALFVFIRSANVGVFGRTFFVGTFYWFLIEVCEKGCGINAISMRNLSCKSASFYSKRII